MSNDSLICPICGEPTFLVYGKHPRKDGLCKNCSQQLFNNEIQQCKDCGKWHKAGETCECKKPAKQPITQESDTRKIIVINKDHKKPTEALKKEASPEHDPAELTCIICGEPSNGKPQCKNCYYETRDFMETLDKNNNVRKLRDHYYNLKERILIIKTLEEAKRQCNRLIAIAMLANELYNDSSLLDRVYKDAETLLKGKQTPHTNSNYEEERKENDKSKSKVNTSQDGHTLESDMEVRIDDILYNAYILHCYGKDIDEITEKRKKCDWFIPIVNDEGIYIEYWGMKTKKYLEDRAEKEALYKKYNIPYIGIEADDPKQDTLTFKSNLIRELTKLAEERFGFMPKWKR